MSYTEIPPFLCSIHSVWNRLLGKKKRQILAINNNNNKSINCILYFHKQHNVLLITALLSYLEENDSSYVSEEAHSPRWAVCRSAISSLKEGQHSAGAAGGLHCSALTWSPVEAQLLALWEGRAVQAAAATWVWGNLHTWSSILAVPIQAGSSPQVPLHMSDPYPVLWELPALQGHCCCHSWAEVALRWGPPKPPCLQLWDCAYFPRIMITIYMKDSQKLQHGILTLKIA